MARYSKESKHSVEVVVQKAVDFFGPEGLGLEVVDQGPACARFEGGGGYVFVEGCAGERGAQVDLETREWDYQVKQFLGQI